ncbi:hypothetical protein BDF20DRAFT_836144 [Mycotypha africana]|uniref:uncharacterized protein n=1 Tax=Mycotypha africana TaxID=64632 RepID=UPI0023018513|nr:uncharacterized protein BDF20DRAFT_836144 [Mycotypha africana]KAI8977329.1 hypothetical protein BDF20DRAFT_836144 [Mycotypha africana]
MEKWKGSFAQSQLEKFGWETGEGLGKNKEGNAKHISVTVKNDKKGVGVNKGDWEFAWWDHLYNKSAHSVVVEKDQEKGEIKVATKKKGENRRSRTGIISTHKPTGKSVITTTTTTSATTTTNPSKSMSAMADERNMMDAVKDVHINIAQRIASTALYGSFVKGSAPSTPATSTPTSEATSAAEDDEEEEEEDDELKDYSMKVSDAELFAACEGRTARKGGRGLVEQTGKFKRVMQEFVRQPEDDEENDIDTKKSEKASSKKDKKRKRLDKDDENDTHKKSVKKSKKSDKESKKAKKSEKKSKEKSDTGDKKKAKKDKSCKKEKKKALKDKKDQENKKDKKDKKKKKSKD